MVRAVYTTLLLLAVTTHVRTQFFDFFSAFQPTLRPNYQFGDTTKRPRTQTKTTRHETTTKRTTPFSFYSEDLDRKKTTSAPLIFDFYSTTTKPSRKTTKSNPSRRHYETSSNARENTSANSNNKLASKEKNNLNNNSRNNNASNNGRINNQSKPKTVNNGQAEPSRNINNDDRLIFDDGRRNTVLNYETTRPNYYTTKPPTVYQGNKKNNPPYTIRPGVKPAVVNGPPITNRPATRRPSFGQRPTEALTYPTNEDDDLSVTPELIIGPSEDYMSTVDKKRYIEMAEKMCDKYKALDIKQIQAIPLVPSPEPVRVNVSTCAPKEAPLIVGGKIATIQEFRHMALLGWNKVQESGYSWKCGGSLISDRYVLTAAHCAYQDRDNNVAIGPPRAVQLGSSLLDDPGAVVVKVAAVVRHPKYKLPKSYYDIALVKMMRSVSFSSVIKPACLGIPPPPGKPIIATGWGRTEFGGDQSQELRSVSLPIWDMTDCYNALGTSRKLPEGPSSDSQVCAGDRRGGKDTCQGDSGGPAQVQDGCSWRVVAVTSVGRACGAAQTPALYAKVPRAFISAVVFAGQTADNNNQQNQNKNQQTSNNQQQWNNNNQQNWNTQQQPSNNQQNWNNNQQKSSDNQQSWNNQKQPTNSQQNWNNQQQSSTNQQSWNNNQQQSNSNQQNWYSQQTTTQNPQHWNRNQEVSSSNQPQLSNQWNYQQQNSNQQNNQQTTEWNNNRNTQNSQGYYDNDQNTSNNYQVNSQKQGSNDNSYYDQNNRRNNGEYNNGRGQIYNDYTTKKSYNNPQGYYSDDFDKVSSDYQSDDGRYYNNDRVWWT